MIATPDPNDAAEMATPDGFPPWVVPIDADAIAVLLLDENGAIQRASQPARDLLGRTVEDLTGVSVTTLQHDPAVAAGILERVRGGETVRDEEVEIRRPDGKRCVVGVNASIADPNAEPQRLHWLLRDITAERESDEYEARLAAIVRTSDDPMVSKQMDGTITNWNPAAERLYGYSAEEAIGKPITLIIPPELDNELPGIMRRLARGERIDHYETVRLTRMGRRIHVSVTITPLRDRAGRIVGASAVTRDITERRLLQRKQREFLTMVAHDLRSPLTSIKGFAQLMQRREAYSPTGIASILNQVRHLERLVGDVLEITRLDEDRQDLIVAPVDMVALVRATIDRAQLLLPTDRISLSASDPELTGTWDADRLTQVLDNVLSNAVKYAPTGPIEVTVRRLGDGVEVAVQDHGRGIAPESLAHIFERFYRVPGEHSASRGVGLGLAISKALVEAHGGTIVATSPPEDGTRVTITLPWDSSLPATA
jgi:PAS domain S-box-containing protein